jgi:D-3-phosphoglycerate dehydrogenase
VKLLVVGDSYMPVEVFRRAFERLGDDHRFEYLQLDMERTDAGGSESERRIREYAGSPGQISERLSDHDGLVVHGGAVTDAVLDAAPGLRLVCCARGGPVNVDVEAATERGIPVVTTPGKNAEAVADLTIAFLVILARGVVRAAGFLAGGGRVGDSAFEGAGWFGHDLGGHLLGLVGYGQVGRRVALRALAMGMAVVSFDPYVAPAAMLADGVRPSEFGQLLEESRFVSVHARQPADGRDLFGETEFARMRAGSYFLNTARETLVDEAALFTALSSGHLAGAALDVLRPRPAGEVNPLVGLANVVATPHIGGATFETLDRGATMIAEEIERFAAGSGLVNVVNPAALVG